MSSIGLCNAVPTKWTKFQILRESRFFLLQEFVQLRRPDYSGHLVVENKLHPRRGSSLEEVQPHPYKGAIKFFKVFMRQLNFRISQNIQIRKLGYSRKKKTWRRGEGRGGWLRIWNFQGYQRNSMWNFQGLIKWNFQG